MKIYDTEYTVLKAGEVLLLTEGEYSDYGHIGDFVALKDCNLRVLATEFLASYVSEGDWDSPTPQQFCAWLVINGWMYPGSIREVHLGAYGRLDIG